MLHVSERSNAIEGPSQPAVPAGFSPAVRALCPLQTKGLSSQAEHNIRSCKQLCAHKRMACRNGCSPDRGVCPADARQHKCSLRQLPGQSWGRLWTPKRGCPAWDQHRQKQPHRHDVQLISSHLLLSRMIEALGSGHAFTAQQAGKPVRSISTLPYTRCTQQDAPGGAPICTHYLPAITHRCTLKPPSLTISCIVDCTILHPVPSPIPENAPSAAPMCPYKFQGA